MEPPEVRRDSTGPPPATLPRRLDFSGSPCTASGMSERTRPPNAFASMSTATPSASATVMSPPEVRRLDSSCGWAWILARMDPPDVRASMAPALPRTIDPPEVRAETGPAASAT